MSPRVPIVDLALRGDELEATTAAIRTVLERGWFVLGPEVDAFERELADAMGRRRVVSVASGTDALVLGLRAMGIGPGDEVVVPAMTAFPTAVAVTEVGATPVLVDVEADRPLLDLDKTMAALSPSTRAVILVHLYGLAADAAAFRDALDARGVALIEDCAQAQGAVLPTGDPVGSAAAFAACSFYPTKNLGALGDGGALATDDDALADEVSVWRSHGERGTRYLHELPARNSRLDDLQAAVLRLRLRGLEASLGRRREISAAYAARLPAAARYAAHGDHGAPHLAVVRCDARNDLVAHLTASGIGTGIHYPHSLDEQPALAGLARTASADNARAWARTCLSLPIHAAMTDDDVTSVVDAATAFSRWQ